MRNGYGHMTPDDAIAKLREIRAERTRRLASLSTREEALAYRQQVRQALERVYSPRPPKGPLNPQVVGRIEGPDYAIERITFESRPNFLVTANLYIPNDLQGPAPCVLGTCGHTDDGKAADLYQGFCQRLAVSGFVVLIYDPINQGERDQYALLTDRDSVRQSTHAHNMMGKQLELFADSFMMWRTWDGIRALDYLLSRPEVDPARVGVTGNSGGGTMTTWLWAADDRFTMAAPSCFVTTFLHNLENELPADSEQYPPGAIGAGLEMADFFIAQAPKPVILLGGHYDYFDRRGHQEAYEDLRRFNELLGAPTDNIACFRGQNPHGYFRENQEAMVDFFCKHAGLQARPVEETTPLDERELYATPEGNVVKAGSKPVFAILADRARELTARRSALSPDALVTRIAELLGIEQRCPVPHYRVLRPARVGDRTYGRYAIETERNIRAMMRKKMARPECAVALDVTPQAHLYIPHESSEEDLSSDSLALTLQEKGELYAVDVRGLGESRPDDDRPFDHPYGMDYMMHGYGVMFGKPYLGRRVWDVLSTLALLRDMGAQEIHLYGRGQGALLALYAAVLDDTIASITLKNAPLSYEEWVTTPIVDWPAANFVRGALLSFDLEDCRKALGGKLTMLDPWGACMEPLT